MVDSSHYVFDAITWFAFALLLEILWLLQGRYTHIHIHFILFYFAKRIIGKQLFQVLVYLYLRMCIFYPHLIFIVHVSLLSL